MVNSVETPPQKQENCSSMTRTQPAHTTLQMKPTLTVEEFRQRPCSVDGSPFAGAVPKAFSFLPYSTPKKSAVHWPEGIASLTPNEEKFHSPQDRSSISSGATSESTVKMGSTSTATLVPPKQKTAINVDSKPYHPTIKSLRTLGVSTLPSTPLNPKAMPFIAPASVHSKNHSV